MEVIPNYDSQWAEINAVAQKLGVGTGEDAVGPTPSRSVSLNHYLPTPFNRPDGFPQDQRVESEVPVLDVTEVQPDRLLPTEVSAPADLPEPGQARPYQQPPLDVRLGGGHLAGQRGPRSDQRHGAAQHVEQLRQLIEGVAAQDRAERGDALVHRPLEQRVGRVVDRAQFGLPGLRVDHRRTETSAW
jgi:hypothetical protein